MWAGTSMRPMPLNSARQDSARERYVRKSNSYLETASTEESSWDEETPREKFVDFVHVVPEALDEDTFGMSVCSIVRDAHSLATLPEGIPASIKCARFVRVGTTIGVLMFTITLQIFLLAKIKQFVTAKAVHDVRVAYSKYEDTVYQCEEFPANCFKTEYGNWRGRPEARPNVTEAERRLFMLSEIDQGNACRISLSQPEFLFAILFIWTMTCLLEMRKCYGLAMDIGYLPSVAMADSLQPLSNADQDGDEITEEALIVGMSIPIKLLLLLLMLLRFLITALLCFLGCRWLLATNQFVELILNAMALEFILVLKELVYNTLMPPRNKIDVQITKIVPYERKLKPDLCSFVSTLFLLFIAAGWTYLYMHKIQTVLPHYQWDVKAVCTNWIAMRFCVDQNCPHIEIGGHHRHSL